MNDDTREFIEQDPDTVAALVQAAEERFSGTKLGGFQAGFSGTTVPREHAKWPQHLICQHDCQEIVQLRSAVSGEIEFELCKREAARMGRVLLALASDEADLSKKMTVTINVKTDDIDIAEISRRIQEQIRTGRWRPME